METPAYDWKKDLGAPPPGPLRPGQTKNTHPLTRALKDSRTSAHALEVLRRALLATEGRIGLLAELLGIHLVVASRMVTRNELAGFAADLRATHGHSGASGYGAPSRGGRKKRPSKRAAHG